MASSCFARVSLLFAAASCVSVPTVQDARLSYLAVVSEWPSATRCLNPPVNEGIAKEVLLGPRRLVVIAGGPHPISDWAWKDYAPPLGNRKNSDRHTLFTRSCFSRSPGRSASCAGDDCREIVEMDGYTWIGLSKVEAADCYPDPGSCAQLAPKPGALLFVVTRKCHELVFEGDVYVLRGPAGEKAIMHATEDGNPTTDVQLPAGWTLTREHLDAPLTVHPFGGKDECFYNIIRDARRQSYHQLEYGKQTYP